MRCGRQRSGTGGEGATARCDLRRNGQICIVRRTWFTFAWMVGSALAAPDVQPLRIIQTVEARFPDGLTQRGIYEGEVRIALMVDADGQLADWLLISYTHPFFAREATEALRRWRFEPARREGEPVGVRTHLTIGFQATGMVVNLSPVDLPLQFQRYKEDTTTVRICGPTELDGPVTAVRTVMPLWPEGWNESTAEARAVVDFYIDDEGRPRMPVVVRSDDTALNFPAIEALSHWRFAPPTRNGQPVIVRAAQTFRFHRRK